MDLLPRCLCLRRRFAFGIARQSSNICRKRGKEDSGFAGIGGGVFLYEPNRGAARRFRGERRATGCVLQQRSGQFQRARRRRWEWWHGIHDNGSALLPCPRLPIFRCPCQCLSIKKPAPVRVERAVIPESMRDSPPIARARGGDGECGADDAVFCARILTAAAGGSAIRRTCRVE